MPHLISAAYTTDEVQPTEFEVTIDDGEPEVSEVQTLEDDSVRLYYDVVALEVGVSHTASIVAITEDAILGDLRSDATEFEFTINANQLVSASMSPSLSPSASMSPSKSPSQSPSASPSEESPSISPSVSPSFSPSEGGENPCFVLSGSTNILDVGEPTTAQLTEPGGGSVFQAGLITDNDNPLDSIDLGNNVYTELEWCIQATSYAETGATYEFRVTKTGLGLLDVSDEANQTETTFDSWPKGQSWVPVTDGSYLYSIKVYLNHAGPETVEMRWGNNIDLNTYLGTHSEVVSGAGWYEFVFADTVNQLSTGTTYYFALKSDGTPIGFLYDSGATYAGGIFYWSSSWNLTGTGSSAYDWNFYIYICQ